MHESGDYDRDVPGQFSLSVDDEPERVLTVRSGRFVAANDDEPFDHAPLGTFAPALDALEDTARNLEARASALSATYDYLGCLADAVTVGTGVGCLTGIGVGIVVPAALPKLAGVGCAGGAAGGFLGGLAVC
jgi:hypothetical protein